MENNAPQYQRATTPTVDTIHNIPVRGKVLSYQSQVRRRKVDSIGQNKDFNATNINSSLIAPSVNSLTRPNGQSQNLNIGIKPVQQQRTHGSYSNEINIQGKAASNNKSNSLNSRADNSNNEQGHSNENSSKNTHLSGTNSSILRHDIIPLSDDIPSDGIIFARLRNDSDTLIVFRTPDERLRNPERLNLDRRQLEKCPILEQEQRLRLLNYQNNNIRLIQNLENLPNLIFLDLYNNKLTSLEGAVSNVRGLRVLMAGKNRINSISNLSHLRKLDVLDLHSNEIRLIEGLNGLTDLRVLNLAGNRVSVIENLSSLQSLTELNLRRNNIERVFDLNHLPSLQRVFLSHNSITMSTDVQCLFSVPSLIELSLDGNPMSDSDPIVYRNHMITSIVTLRHLDLKKITDEERALAFEIIKEAEFKSLEAEINGSELIENKLADDENKIEHVNMNIDNNANFEIKNNLVIDDPISNHNFEESIKWKSTTILNGLATQARTGKITNNQSLLDLEMIGPNEKALIAIGDSWEWVQSKRLFANVTEASLYHMKKDIIINRFMSNITWLPLLKVLRLHSNDIETLKELDSVTSLLSPTIESLIIQHNPICISISLLRLYIIATVPCLKSFNDVEITLEERKMATLKFQNLLSSQRTVVSNSKINSKLGAIKALGVNTTTTSTTTTNISQKRTGDGTVTLSTKPNSGVFDDKNSSIICQELTLNILNKRSMYDEFNKAFEEAVEEILLQTINMLREK